MPSSLKKIWNQWLEKILTEEDYGKIRLVHRFLWFPTKLNGTYRWWSKEYIVQVVAKRDVGGTMEWGHYKYFWTDYDWLDQPEACFALYKEILYDTRMYYIRS